MQRFFIQSLLFGKSVAQKIKVETGKIHLNQRHQLALKVTRLCFFCLQNFKYKILEKKKKKKESSHRYITILRKTEAAL